MSSVYADVSETASNRSDNPIPPLVVVTGCDRGVGLWVAVASLQWGFKVLAGVLDQTSPGAQQLLARGAQVTQLDVTRSDDVTRLLGDIMALEDLGDAHLACLVNNAGVLAYAPLEWQRAAHVQHQLRVNLEGLVMVTAALLPLLRRNKGRVINISSPQGLVGTPSLGVYCASKWGVEGFTAALRRELAQQQVKVVTVRPCNIPHMTGIMEGNARLLKHMKADLHPYTAADQGRELDDMIQQFQVAYSSRKTHEFNGSSGTNTNIHKNENGRPVSVDLPRASATTMESIDIGNIKSAEHEEHFLRKRQSRNKDSNDSSGNCFEEENVSEEEEEAGRRLIFEKRTPRIEAVADFIPGDPLLIQCIKDAMMSPHPRRSYNAAPLVVRAYLWLLQCIPSPVVDWLLMSGAHNAILNWARPS